MSYTVGDITKIRYKLNELPNECPHCFKSIKPNFIDAFYNHNAQSTEVFMVCPDVDCSRTFIAYYNGFREQTRVVTCQYLNKTSKGSIAAHDFSQLIEEKFPRFCEIYDDAYYAEQEGLNHICGLGYRKALEVLVKDYIINKEPAKKEIIIKTALQNCIKDHISNLNIQAVAKRATWLGNDETHYVKEYVDKDVTHLKDLIELTVSWIEMEEKTAKYIQEIPEKIKPKLKP